MKIGIELKNVMNLIVRYTHKLSDHEVITMKQAAILKYLIDNNTKDITSKDLEDNFSMRRSTCSRMLSTMESNGFIVRVNDEFDTRKKTIKLTEKSISIFKQIDERFISMEENVRKNIDEEELQIFFKVLEQIKQNLITENEE